VLLLGTLLKRQFLELNCAQQGLATRETGHSLQSSNPDPPMSALGQKRTLGNVASMSALPPKADID
jgi:hypothetical protein